MDEIIIEEKKYVSSKQAAKITGYAKDYIGQLCREGRVPSRLVGRSWYVLESAIKDHRFGSPAETRAEESQAPAQGTADAGKVEDHAEAQSSPYPMVEFPRYESAPVETLPSLNLLNKQKEESVEKDAKENRAGALPDLQGSWKEWFDTAGASLAEVDAPVVGNESVEKAAAPKSLPELTEDRQKQEDEQPQKLAAPEDAQQKDDASVVPLHIRQLSRLVTDVPPNERNMPSGGTTAEGSRRRASAVTRTVLVSSVAIAVVAAIVAIIGSGYLDSYATSLNRASMLTGISVYNK